MIESLSLLALGTAALAGFITVFLPCTYPMLLGYIALIIGSTEKGSTVRAVVTALWFFAGFALTYTLFGTLAGLFGQFSSAVLLANSARPILLTLGGVFFVIIGLVLLRAIPLPERLRSIRSVRIPKQLSVQSWWGAAVIGVIFAAGWSPCIGPVLGGILVLAGSSGSVVAGGLLLLMFSVGMMLPILFLTVLYSAAADRVQGIERCIPYMRALGGLLFIVLGISFIVGDWSFLGQIPAPAFLERYI